MCKWTIAARATGHSLGKEGDDGEWILDTGDRRAGQLHGKRVGELAQLLLLAEDGILGEKKTKDTHLDTGGVNGVFVLLMVMLLLAVVVLVLARQLQLSHQQRSRDK